MSLSRARGPEVLRVRQAVASRQGDASRIPFSRFLSPAGGEDRGEGGRTAQAESNGEGGRTQRLEVAPAAPLTLPSPPKGRGKEERAPRAAVTEVRRAPAIAWQQRWREPASWHCAPVGLPAPRPTCLGAGTHSQARQAGRATRRAASTTREGSRSPSRAPGRCMAAGTRVAHPLFPIPLPRRGRGSRRGGDAPRKRSRRERGAHPEARGGASGPPHPSLSPGGERERRTRTRRGNDRGGASGFCCHPRAWPLHGSGDGDGLRRGIALPLACLRRAQPVWVRARTGRPARQVGRTAGRRAPRARGPEVLRVRQAVAWRQGRASRIPFSRFLSPGGGEDQGERGRSAQAQSKGEEGRSAGGNHITIRHRAEPV